MAASHDSMHAPPSPSFNGTSHRRTMMPMTFFWGDSTVLFSGWPGRDDPVMYVMSLAFVLVLAVLAEWLSHCSFIKSSANNFEVGMWRTCWYTVRSGMYLVMLAVTSFNGGVFLAAVGRHALGFLAALFGSRAGQVMRNGWIFLPVLADNVCSSCNICNDYQIC